MVTEIMLLLIVLGVGIVAIAWTNTRRRKQEAIDRREVEDSTGKLKQELERTAGEIIGRMENHVAHLENVLDESERNRMQLEGRVVELKKLLKKSEGQSGEIRDLLARLDDAGAEVDKMQRKMDVVERKLNLAITTSPIVQPPVTIPQMTSPPLVNPMMTPPITPTPMPTMAPMTSMPQITPTPITPINPAPHVTVTTPPPAVPLNPLGSITIPPLVRPQTSPPAQEKIPPVEPPKVEVDTSNDFDKILEETIAEPVTQPTVRETSSTRPPDRSSIILSPEKKPMTVVEGDPVKIEATRKRLNEASAEMADNPPEEISEVVIEQQTKALKRRRRTTGRSGRDVRKAAVEAIKAAEESSTIEVKAVEVPKEKAVDKKVLPERRDLKLETTDSSIVKEMLLSGMSIEEISRETGLGRGAIELIQELTRRQLDKR